MTEFKIKHVTVLGLGRFGGGISVARWLVEQGAHVTVTDRDGADKLADSVSQLHGLPITFRLGESRVEDFTKPDLVVTSPAVKPSHEMLQAAHDAGVPVTTEIALFVERCEAPIIGVTGTKGKSTTAAMLGHLLKSVGPCYVGGNIGKSLLSDLEVINRSRATVVLELSSFMLYWLGRQQFSPSVAVLTMLGLDHLDWHGNAGDYIDAKRNIVRHQLPGGRFVRRGDELSRTFTPPAGVVVREYPDPSIPPFDLALPGEHNAANAQAAFLAVESPGVFTWDHAQRALKTFTGLPHRLQLVHEAGGVRFYNDSIATIPEAAVIAAGS
ncbi:MAG TPA: UDP-N-acetylmuramoyl-L-alanine--D-glutamate ligase, partial [Tepidisphaeraceae bacterium]